MGGTQLCRKSPVCALISQGICDRCVHCATTHNNCAETHLGGGDTCTSAFVVPSAAIARSLSLPLVASTV